MSSGSSAGRQLKIREAERRDLDQLLDLIMELAIQEGTPEEVETTREQLDVALFNDSPSVFVTVVEDPEDSERIVAFALWWIDFPTWQGRHGIYIEDICVTRELRGQGIGKTLMSHLAQICLDRDYARLAWWVKNDNQSAIDFYSGMGADIKDDFTVRHLSGEELASLANRA